MAERDTTVCQRDDLLDGRFPCPAVRLCPAGTTPLRPGSQHPARRQRTAALPGGGRPVAVSQLDAAADRRRTRQHLAVRYAARRLRGGAARRRVHVRRVEPLRT